jgi:transcriptional regulator with XRE-family HTH domain
MDLNSSERIFLEELGKRVRRERERAELSSAEVARRLLMDRGNYSRIETGKTNPSSLTLHKVAQVLGCEVNDFFSSD